MFLFLVPSAASVNFVVAQGQTGDGQFPQSIMVSSITDTTPHLLKLKATQQGGTETRVGGFSLDATNTVGAQANSQLLVLVTDSSLRVTEAKVRTASNQSINLESVFTSQQAAAFSLANLPGGVYTLDVITQKGDAKAAYEGVLSIGHQPLTVIEEICTPDGPPCPPCPEGVVADWCADEDERQDTEDPLLPPPEDEIEEEEGGANENEGSSGGDDNGGDDNGGDDNGGDDNGGDDNGGDDNGGDDNGAE
jgi:hypothetical protein